MEWNEAEILVWNMEDARMERNERFQNRMEDNRPYFHINSVLDFAHGLYRKIYTDKNIWKRLAANHLSTNIR